MTERISAEEYADSLMAEDLVLEQVRRSLHEHGIRDISIVPGYGRLLTMLVKLSGASRVLEIGALGGYSGICLARGMGPGGRLVSLEINPDYAQLAKANLTAAGFGDRVEYRIGDAPASLAKLKESGEQFDFFFIDADKGNYPLYMDYAIQLASPGALIIGDNTWLKGRIVSPDAHGHSVTMMREFNRRIAQDPRLEGVILPAYDGLAIARVKE